MKQGRQTSTPDDFTLEVKKTPIPFEMLDMRQQNWVDYNAVQGLITEADGEMHKMTQTDFARQMGVDRSTLYNWVKQIPNFWDLVEDRRKLLAPGARTMKVWNSLFLNATVKMNVTAQLAWLSNSSKNFRMPSQKVEHDIGGGFADVINRARALEAEHETVIEGEVVNEPTKSEH